MEVYKEMCLQEVVWIWGLNTVLTKDDKSVEKRLNKRKGVFGLLDEGKLLEDD